MKRLNAGRLNQVIGVTIAIATTVANIEFATAASHKNQTIELEEVIVTAQKREQSLQSTPIAVSVLTDQQISRQRVSNLGDLSNGTLSSLHVAPSPNAPSTLAVAIRGNGPVNIDQTTREGAVAIYIDDIYLGRAQGLTMELADLQRLEVLRGPQGTLFGRNATGGAISIVTKKPTGKLEIKQTIGVGRFDELRSVTHIDLPTIGNVRAKFSYMHAERDGWVENIASGEADYNAFEKDGGRLNINWQLNDSATIDYVYDQSNAETVQNYFQLYEDFIGVIGEERDRKTQTRFAIAPLDPTITDHQGHALTMNWELSDNLQLKSLSAYRELDDKTRNNYGGASYFNGFIEAVDAEQEQLSQEFRLVGNSNRLEWVTGLFFYKENVVEKVQALFSLDIFGDITGEPLSPMNPTNFDVFTGEFIPEKAVEATSKSAAIYGQVTWTPPLLDDRLHLTLGTRYSDDEKKGTQADGSTPFDLTTTQTTPALTFAVDVTENVFGYLKWSTAYRGGGVNSRSAALSPYEPEEVETYEIGIKSEFYDHRLRLNAALFSTDYENMIIDVIHPTDPSILETINAKHKASIEGLEIEFSIVPVAGLNIGLNYTYLDDEIPLQPNILTDDNLLQRFLITQTPCHTGSFTVDYTKPSGVGTLFAHIDVTSTDKYNYWSTNNAPSNAYTLFNAKLALLDIAFGKGTLTPSLWVKNITDEEYRIGGFSIEGVSTVTMFGEPRTYGVDIVYQF